MVLEDDSSPTFENCIFTNDSAAQGGGAVYDSGNSSPTFVDCVFAGNSAQFGGAVYNTGDSSPTFVNCTFSNNTTTTSNGGAIYDSTDSQPVLTNCVLWQDTAQEIANVSGSDALLTYCDIDQTSYTQSDELGVASSNIDLNPDFVGGGNYQILSGSACINRGNNNAIAGVSYDLGDNLRIAPANTGIVDIGAYEYQGPFIIYVDASAHGSNTGSDWPNAFNSLGSALAAATSGYTIDVAAGTYFPGAAAIDTFQLINGVKIQGGYAVGGSAAPIPSLYTSTFLVGHGVDYTVVTGDGINSTAILDGFAILGGNAHGTGLEADGGGLADDNGSPTIIYCTFNEDSASNDGGAVYNSDGSSPTFIDCAFYGNTAGSYGGAIYNDASSPNLTSCSIANNSAGAAGGAWRTRNTSSPVVLDSIMWNDSATPTGEIYNSNSTPLVAYGDVEGGYPGGNINQDPDFVSSTNLEPLTGSPAVNTGAYTVAVRNAISAGYTTDLAGFPRIAQSVIDIGAYENQGTTGLVFTQQPSNVLINNTITPFISLNEEAGGVLATTNNPMVTLSIASGPSGAAITGVHTVQAIGGQDCIQ